MLKTNCLKVIPASSNYQFYPTLKDIRNHMYKAAVKLHFSKLDQANVDIKIQQWKKELPNDKFYFCDYGGRIEEEEKDIENMDGSNEDLLVSCILFAFLCLLVCLV